jgi:hypothetical protein
MEIKKSLNIITLRGVNLKELIASTTTQKVVEKKYTEIPKQFTSVDNWPKSSNLKCWECDLIGDSYPRFIPIYPQYRTPNEPNEQNQPICDVLGHFDDWSCVARYIVREYPRNKADMLAAICIFEALFSGHKKDKIMPCLSKTKMQDYCGESGLTIEQYKKQRNMIM